MPRDCGHLIDQIITALLRGGLLDSMTLLTAFAYAFIRWLRSTNQRFVSGDTGRDVIHGLPLFPLALLVLSVGSEPALDALLHTRKVLAAAGAVALFSILEKRPVKP